MAEAVAGGAFLSASLQVLFDRMASREFLNFFSGRTNAKKLLKKLKLAFLALKAVLNDAEDKQIANKAVSEWLEELKDALYHADDLVDGIATLALQSKLEPDRSQSIGNQVLSFFSNPIFSSDEDMESRLEEMIDTLEYFVSQRGILGLKDNVERKQSQMRLRTTSSLVDDSDVYGRDSDKQKMIQFLVSDDEGCGGIGVIPLVGMGGVGKTTLAQLAYNDCRVDAKFDLKAWVCVSEDFDVLTITREIVVAVVKSNAKMNDFNLIHTNLDLLQTMLKQKLTGKKFLLVLDDVWNENYMLWDILVRPFKDGAKGSRIIVTTRSQEVARVVRTVPSHQMEQLRLDDCWSLFVRHAFENGDSNAYPHLKMIGKEIVEKCNGLPLAVKSLGGLLRGKVDAEEWDNVLKSEIWDLQGESILPALRLSYYHLPSHLKRCFAYCSIFPKNYEFEEEELVRLWIAEDLVQQPKSNKTMEDECECYFKELLSRSFFLHSSHTYFRTTYPCIVMHDLIHDVARYISGEFCFVLQDDNKRQGISEKVRHFSYVRTKYDASDKFKVIYDIKCLRTFIGIDRHRITKSHPTSIFSNLGDKMLHSVLPTLICLRVLSLPGYYVSKLPESIGNLIHLRYLDLSQTHIKQLPKSIANLCHLRTLNLFGCGGLTKLPADMRKLINLRHLDIRGTGLTEMPVELSRIKGLQSLTNFVVGKDTGSRIEELRDLDHLHGELTISGLQNVVDAREALQANFKVKCLEALILRWSPPISRESGNFNDSEIEKNMLVLDGLKPSPGVINLEIEDYPGTRFPNWVGDNSFHKIVSLSIIGCVYCDSLPSLGQLPSLKNLKVARMKGIRQVGRELYGNVNKPFQSLETLIFDDMPEWKEWNVSEDGKFPHLLNLNIRDCPKLKGELPCNVPSLRILHICECQELAGIEKIVQHLPSLQQLKISGLLNLKQLPSELCRLTSLQELRVWNCPNLKSFPDKGLPPMLRTLDFYKCEALQSSPEAIMRFNSCLEELQFHWCSSLMFLPIGDLPATLKLLSIAYCEKLEFSGDPLCTSIQKVEIINSSCCLKYLHLDFFPKLTFLVISGCIKFKTLSIQDRLQNLKALLIEGCPDMISFPDGGLRAPNLIQFGVRRCKNLKFLPQQMHTLLPCLQSLHIYDCPQLESFPDSGLPSNLHSLKICNCQKLKWLPQGMHTLLSLQSLRIDHCPYLESFPEGDLPSNLHSLEICKCEKLTQCRTLWNLWRLPSLKEFKLGDDYSLQSFPGEWLLPSTLTSLEITHLPNLKSVDKSIEHLSSLQSLSIYHCPVLLSLPEGGLPNSLYFLTLCSCPLLIPHCKRNKGKYWPKVAHTPCMQLDGEIILE